MRTRLADENGFTLIELLVVILIIGILAAIALPNFLGQRARGQDASAKSNARNAVSMVEACYTDTQDYSKCTTNSSTSLGANTGLNFVTSAPSNAGDVYVNASSSAPDAYTITAHSASGLTTVGKGDFSIQKITGTGQVIRTCDTPGTGACPANKSW